MLAMDFHDDFARFCLVLRRHADWLDPMTRAVLDPVGTVRAPVLSDVECLTWAADSLRAVASIQDRAIRNVDDLVRFCENRPGEDVVREAATFEGTLMCEPGDAAVATCSLTQRNTKDWCRVVFGPRTYVLANGTPVDFVLRV